MGVVMTLFKANTVQVNIPTGTEPRKRVSQSHSLLDQSVNFKSLNNFISLKFKSFACTCFY